MSAALRVLATIALLIAAGWGGLALYFSGPRSYLAPWILGLGFALLGVGLIFLVHPYWRGVLGFLGLFTIVLVWWLLLPPSNERDFT